MKLYTDPAATGFLALKWVATLLSFLGIVALVPFFLVVLAIFFAIEPLEIASLSKFWLFAPLLFVAGQLIFLLLAIWHELGGKS